MSTVLNAPALIGTVKNGRDRREAAEPIDPCKFVDKDGPLYCISYRQLAFVQTACPTVLASRKWKERDICGADVEAGGEK